MALIGSIQDFNLFSIFTMIKSQNKIGTFVVQNENASVKIVIDSGSVIGINSSKHDMDDGLLLNLMRLGLISPEEMQSIADIHTRTLKSIKKIAVESNLVPIQNIQTALTMQTMDIICPIFCWKDGNYRFDSIVASVVSKPDDKIFPAISIDAILLEAAQFVDEWPYINEHLPDYSQSLVRTTKSKSATDEGSNISENAVSMEKAEMPLSHQEEVVLSYFQQPNSINDIISTSKFSELETCKCIASLLENKFLKIYGHETLQTPSMLLQISDIKKKQMKMFAQSSALFWPSIAIFILIPFVSYLPIGEKSINKGIAGICRHDTQISNKQTEERIAIVKVLNSAKVVEKSISVPTGLSENDLINKKIAELFEKNTPNPDKNR